jgi:hypothetical protein
MYKEALIASLYRVFNKIQLYKHFLYLGFKLKKNHIYKRRYI